METYFGVYTEWALLAINIISAFVLWWLARFITKIIKKGIERLERKDMDDADYDPTRYSFIKNSIGVIIYTIAIILIISLFPPLQKLSTALFAGAGVFAAIVGFASQKAFSNIISGIFIIIFKPFRVGDIIEISNNQSGVVIEITLRHTIINNFENRRIIIPNSIISDETIINSSIHDPKICRHIFFHIPFESNLEEAIQIIRHEIENHPNLLDNRTLEDIENGVLKVPVRVINWTDSGIQLRADAWSANPGQSFALKTDILKSTKEAFDKAGIPFPYPHRVVFNK